MIVPVDVGVGEKLTTPDADQDSCNIIISWRVDVMGSSESIESREFPWWSVLISWVI